MKEEIVNIPLTQEVIKRGYIKIPASISKKYKIRRSIRRLGILNACHIYY